jgi:hypothetical protein
MDTHLTFQKYNRNVTLLLVNEQYVSNYLAILSPIFCQDQIRMKQVHKELQQSTKYTILRNHYRFTLCLFSQLNTYTHPYITGLEFHTFILYFIRCFIIHIHIAQDVTSCMCITWFKDYFTVINMIGPSDYPEVYTFMIVFRGVCRIWK